MSKPGVTGYILSSHIPKMVYEIQRQLHRTPNPIGGMCYILVVFHTSAIIVAECNTLYSLFIVMGG